MKYDMEKLLRNVYHQEIKPDNILNQRALRRMQMEEQNDMKKSWSVKKTAVAAALACLVVTQGVGAAYAAINHTSILSLFTGESKEIQDRAKTLRETEVDQAAGSNANQSAYAAFSVREALCDKNHVYVETVAKPASDRYLLVPSECWSEKEDWSIEELGIKGEKDTEETIAQYAKRMNKTCVEVNMWVNAPADSQSISYQTEADGTLVYDISFENTTQKEKLDYTCDTVVYLPGQDEKKLEDSIAFTQKDQTGDVQTIHYVPGKDNAIDGTKLVLDGIDFEKSALNMKCTVKYHTTDANVKDWKSWCKTDDSDVCFYLLDENGNEVESKGSYGQDSIGKDGSLTECDEYSTADLGDTLTFLVRNCMTKEVLGTVTVTQK